MDDCDLLLEWSQARAEGRKLGELENRFGELLERSDQLQRASATVRWDFRQQVLALTDAVQRCSLDPAAAAAEPSDWAAIDALLTAPADPVGGLGDDDWEEHLSGALTARIVGCLLENPSKPGRGRTCKSGLSVAATLISLTAGNCRLPRLVNCSPRAIPCTTQFSVNP